MLVAGCRRAIHLATEDRRCDQCIDPLLDLRIDERVIDALWCRRYGRPRITQAGAQEESWPGSSGASYIVRYTTLSAFL